METQACIQYPAPSLCVLHDPVLTVFHARSTAVVTGRFFANIHKVCSMGGKDLEKEEKKEINHYIVLNKLFD